VAQEREKSTIVLASILKPVDDTRMTAKVGVTLSKAGYDVTVIGYQPSGQVPPGIAHHSLGTFRRLGIQRWLARWRVFGRAFQIRPTVFIFSTHELILTALLLKIILGTRIIYDVRENYYRNIRHSEGLPWLLRLPLALWVRGIEKITAPMIDHFFLAEEGYDKEFRFHRGGWTLLENKALPGADRHPGKVKGLKLLFSGTLSASTGVFRALHLAHCLHETSPAISLTIAGYAAVEATQRQIKELAADKPYIQLVGIDQLVPHEEILRLIAASDAGIIAYQKLPHTTASVPTKLFEYLQASLPIITENQWPWISRFAYCSPFLFTDFENPDANGLLHALQNNPFYTAVPENTAWASDEKRLLEAIKTLV